MTFQYIDIDDVLDKSKECADQFLLGVYTAMSLNRNFVFNASFDTLKLYVLHETNSEYFCDAARDFAMLSGHSVLGPEKRVHALLTTARTMASTSWFSDRVGDHHPWVKSVQDQKRTVLQKRDSDQEEALRRGRRTDNMSRALRQSREAEDVARRKIAAITVDISPEDAFLFLTECWDKIQKATESVLLKQDNTQQDSMATDSTKPHVQRKRRF